jgi:hypothetical protein
MAGDLLLVFTNAAEGREDEFHEWYETTHIPDVLAVPGVVAAQRYQVAEVETPDVEDAPEVAPPAHGFLVAYSLERDGNAVMAEFGERLTDGRMALSDVMDFATISLSVWRPLGEQRHADA